MEVWSPHLPEGSSKKPSNSKNSKTSERNLVELIGSNYTPSARNLSIKNLPANHRVKQIRKRTGENKKRKNTGFHKMASSYMSLKDLLTEVHVPAHLKRPPDGVDVAAGNSNSVISPRPRDPKATGRTSEYQAKRTKQSVTSEVPVTVSLDEKAGADFVLGFGRMYFGADPGIPMEVDDQLALVRELYFVKISGFDELEYQKYWKFVENIPDASVLQWTDQLLTSIQHSVPVHLLNRHSNFTYIYHRQLEDIKQAHAWGLKKGVADYLLLDGLLDQQRRITIFPLVQKTVIRAPIPWHTQCSIAKERLRHYLFIGHPVALGIRKLWNSRWRSKQIVNVEKWKLTKLPLGPQELHRRLTELINEGLQFLEKNWIPTIANLFVDLKHTWIFLVPEHHSDSQRELACFFASICILMSKQLRKLVYSSMTGLIKFFEAYKLGNDYITISQNGYHDLIYKRRSVLSVNLRWDEEEQNLVCAPSVDPGGKEDTCLSAVMDIFYGIQQSCTKIPRIECYLFPEMKNLPRFIPTCGIEEDEIQELLLKMDRILRVNLVGPKLYAKTYKKYLWLLNGEAEKKLEVFMSKAKLYGTMGDKIAEYRELMDEITLLPDTVSLNLIEVDCGNLNRALLEKLSFLIDKIILGEVEKNKALQSTICRAFEEMSAKTSERVESTSELVQLSTYMSVAKAGVFPKLRNTIYECMQRLLFLLDYHIFTDAELAIHNTVWHWPTAMSDTFDNNSTRLQIIRDQAEEKLDADKEAFEGNLVLYLNELEIYKNKESPHLKFDEMKTNAEALTDLNAKIKACVELSKALNQEEKYLDQRPSVFGNLQVCVQMVEPYFKLWTTAYDFHVKYDAWFEGPFAKLDAESIVEQVESMWKLMYQLSKIFSEQPGPKRVADTMRGKIERFKQHLPLLVTICNPGLRERHWSSISELAGIDVQPTAETSLSDIIETGVGQKILQMEEISSAATKEHYLERNLSKMMTEWTEIKFDCVTYRDTGISVLTALDDIQTLLDDHILKAQTMKGSPYIKPLEGEMEVWEDKLISMQSILDSWIQVQSTWMYLYAIFSSPDIVKQMPSEARKFNTVDKLWRNLMKNTSKKPKVLDATEFPNMLRDLNRAIVLLEEIQVGLNEYLEKKRHFFPRFFFLSNDELLEILSETKDPTKVQPHLRKCFEGIQKLEFSPVDGAITHMVSAEDEKIQLVSHVRPTDSKGMVEKWLAQVEAQMYASVRDIIFKAVSSYSGAAKRKDWVLKWPGQAVLCGDCVHWTKDVSEAILNGNLEKCLAGNNAQIDQLVKLVQGNLSPGQRITLGALIVIAVHARDVVAELHEFQVKSLMDFRWISQLRYYIEGAGNQVVLRMITTEIEYGFEYLGNSGRLVITPLTDRCYRTLMSAIKLNLGGAPEGPAGTGKTETCKDLAKAVAKQCLVFNCSDGLDHKAMAKFFKGLAQSGSWCIFDEFNRIQLEVLSVVAQQIQTIQKAIAAKAKTFVLEHTELKLVPSCAIFITMNPGYAGRQELPDNLKVLFRTVAMMLPDYVLIGQITLYSTGFIQAQSLARKIVDTYRLCSEQLSSQHHYDYGMRAVKSVLTAAGALKLKYGNDTDEARLVLKALNDVNLPKFLAQDVPLFEGIISDLFPDQQVLRPDLAVLVQALEDVCKLKHLQPTCTFLEKVRQIYEMVLVRHGVMIVGDAMAGKSSAYQCLATALTEISLKNLPGLNENVTYYRAINPKSITLGQLYGCFDAISHEWSDGVLSNAFRAMAVTNTADRKWIVFDGPVDVIWVENLNTVLDDNRKLCLMSGEIIQMSSTMTMLFETGDLEHASPATVSRCGMIYMEPKQLGWKPIQETFMAKLPEVVTSEQREILGDLFDWLIDPCLKFVQIECPQFVKVSDLHLFQSFLRIYNANLRDQKEIDETQPLSSVWLQTSFIFAIIWGLGSLLTNEGRLKFDAFFRHLVVGNNKAHPRPKLFKLQRNQIFPDKNTCFDFVCDKKNNQWLLWTLTLDRSSLVIPQHAKVTQVIVPTDEMARQLYFLKLLTKNKIPILFMGPTGTGKSAITLNHLASAHKDLYVSNVINFSARTSANQTQDLVMSKLDRRKRGIFGPPMGKECIVFVDDLNMPQPEVYGSQPPIELLRQWLDHGMWFDLKDTTSLKLEDLLFVAAMGVPGGGRNEITQRFLRHLSVVTMDAFDDTTMKKIFSTITEWHFAKGYDADVAKWSKNIVNATLSVYQAVTSVFLPTPTKSHYVFNLRDFSRVIQGVLMIPPAYMTNGVKLQRLWVHEVYRVFHDRLVNVEDRDTFFTLVSDTVRNNFKTKIPKLLEHLSSDGENVERHDLNNLIFGDFMDTHADVRVYDEISDFDELLAAINSYLADYNSSIKTPLNLVVFKFAIEHVARISRVLKQERGHALLIGIGGSGRQSLTKLATFMAGYDLVTLEITRTYGFTEWREDIRKTLKNAGSDGRQTVLLFTDVEIKNESFLEDVNMLLNTCDIPGIFPSEEKAEILEKMQQVLEEMGKKGETSPLALYNFFIEQIRSKLHIVIGMSPVSDSFRHRLRMFPSLINCCTVNWFTEWPSEALDKVARTFLVQLTMDSVLLDSCVAMCKHFHNSARLLSKKFAETLSRHTYVTPSLYLELITSFKQLLATKRNETEELRERYLTGLEKLDYAAAQVIVMQNELTQLQPILIETSAATEKLMIKIERDTVNVEATKEVVAADEALANEAAAAAQAIKDDCENDLAEAIPALEAALQALDTLKPADITVVKSMKNPPGAIKMVLEAICIMRGIKSDRKTDSSGRQYDDFWGPSMKMLGDLKFLEALKEYDKDNVHPSTMKRIREKFIKNPDFEPSVIRNVSTACEGLCKWVKAMEVYDRVIKIVEPKKQKLQEAEDELQAQMDKLNEKRAQLQRVTDKLQALNDEYAAMNKKKRDLEENISLCSQKLARAEKLIDGLSGEKQRWGEGATMLSTRLHNILGDVLISAAVVSYLGPFTVDFRQECFLNWQKFCSEQKIPCSEVFSLTGTLGDQVRIRNWNLKGLPIDAFSIDNAIIISNSQKWPLMIDPQNQASKWIRTMEKERHLAVTKLSDARYLRVVETAVQLGRPVLIENVGEELDPALDSVLLKQTFRQGPQVFLRIGDEVVEYHQDFRLYLITRLTNPHYLPETAIKVTLMNFMITPMGLQDQLLGIVASKENPSLEDQKNKLVIEGVNNKNLLKEIEDKILKVLSGSKGNILEDESGIQILSTSKELSEEILKKQSISASTEKKIDETRNLYRPVAIHSSTLFFCISQLASIDPMYQYSLNWFMNLYRISIRNSKPSKELGIRIQNINTYFTTSVYINICRSIFDKDKLLFSFVLCAAILRSKGDFNEDLWTFVLSAGSSNSDECQEKKPQWLPAISWSRISELSKLDGFEELQNDIGAVAQWREIYRSKRPQTAQLPGPWAQKTGLDRLAILQCLRPDKLVGLVRTFIIEKLGKDFVEPPIFDMRSSFEDSSPSTPLIFVLSPGADPMTELTKFATDRNMIDSLFTPISLGQGQGPIAERLIEDGVVEGGWIVLQNCHLAPSWMPTLQLLCEDVITSSTASKTFRLWLTSYPSDAFPISVLQNGIKMTNETPQNLRSHLLQSYKTHPISDEIFYDSVPGSNAQAWKKMVFGLCFFHALVQERKKYGPLGWNIPYGFNESDLKISLSQLQMFLVEYDSVPLEALTYLIGECNYGGRVTDDKDRRLLMSLLSSCYSPDICGDGMTPVSPCGKYSVPEDLSYDACVEYIKGLPSDPSPEVFGLHSNASVTRGHQDAQQLLERTLLTQTSSTLTTLNLETTSTKVTQTAQGILAKLPAPFNMSKVDSKYPVDYANSMNTVLRQELFRFNRLVDVVRGSLENVLKAVKGQVVMTPEMDQVFHSVLYGKIPLAWAARSYPSLKPLGGYVADLIQRLAFFQSWIDNGSPQVFWLSGFYFTQSFLTGVSQNYARKYKIPIDDLEFDFQVTKYVDVKSVETAKGFEFNQDHAMVEGLYLEGARWDVLKGMLAEAKNNVLHDKLPIILFKPTLKTKLAKTSAYEAPVYKTTARRGTLSTTGHSTNFVMFLKLRSNMPQKHWVNRGVACICQLDN